MDIPFVCAAEASHASQGLMVLDTACAATCAGEQWMKTHAATLRGLGLQVRSHPAHMSFRFGGGPLERSVCLKRFIGAIDGKYFELRVHVIGGERGRHLPLLASKGLLKQLGCRIDLTSDVADFSALRLKCLPLVTTAGGHYAVSLLDFGPNLAEVPALSDRSDPALEAVVLSHGRDMEPHTAEEVEACACQAATCQPGCRDTPIGASSSHGSLPDCVQSSGTHLNHNTGQFHTQRCNTDASDPPGKQLPGGTEDMPTHKGERHSEQSRTVPRVPRVRAEVASDGVLSGLDRDWPSYESEGAGAVSHYLQDRTRTRVSGKGTWRTVFAALATAILGLESTGTAATGPIHDSGSLQQRDTEFERRLLKPGQRKYLLGVLSHAMPVLLAEQEAYDSWLVERRNRTSFRTDILEVGEHALLPEPPL
eukprot:6491771-Amphidinium_carterae.1